MSSPEPDDSPDAAPTDSSTDGTTIGAEGATETDPDDQGDVIDRLPDWLVSRDEEDVVSERLDRTIRFFATYFP